MTYEKYLKKIKKEKRIIIIFQIFLFILFLLLWQYLSDNNYINSFITSSPKRIIKTIILLYKQNNLFIHIFTTIKETIISFILTSLISILIAIILYNNKILSKIIEPYLTILNSLPKVALGPIIIIWMGANNKSIILMSILISLIVSIQTILIGFQSTDLLKIKLMNMFNASKLQKLFYLVIPYNKKIIFNTFKINISMCLIGVISGEFLTSKSGIGYLILYGSQIFNLDLVLTGIFLLMIISIIMYKLVSFLSK